MENLNTFFTTLLTSLDGLGVWGYWLILLVALADSLVIVGTFIPGTAFVLLAGILVSEGIYDLGDMAIFASVGALIGSVTSYYLGFRGVQLFKSENRFFTEKHLEHGEGFFEKYGNAGILICRFLGPASSIASFIAGLAHMNARTFLLWSALSSLMWGVSYTFIGSFLGNSLHFLP